MPKHRIQVKRRRFVDSECPAPGRCGCDPACVWGFDTCARRDVSEENPKYGTGNGGANSDTHCACCRCVPYFLCRAAARELEPNIGLQKKSEASRGSEIEPAMWVSLSDSAAESFLGPLRRCSARALFFTWGGASLRTCGCEGICARGRLVCRIGLFSSHHSAPFCFSGTREFASRRVRRRPQKGGGPPFLSPPAYQMSTTNFADPVRSTRFDKLSGGDNRVRNLAIFSYKL